MLSLKKEPKNRCKIEQVFASKGRVKIIKILLEEEELNISEIVDRCRLNHKSTLKHLKFLTKIGILQEKIYGRIRIYRIRFEDYRVKAIKDMFDIWKTF
ncbi:MAG: ArsR family transcriptional regulator [Promethearchaeota archaeon]|nr:MAG: ArsR family transcriptional regulator [Candidatus Lokiarchaeota archaeon]